MEITNREYISSILSMMSKQKEISAIVCIKNSKYFVNMQFNNKYSNLPIFTFCDYHEIHTGDVIVASFFYKDSLYRFEAAVSEVSDSAVKTEFPTSFFAASKRVCERHKLSKEPGHSVLYNGVSYPLDDISINGFSFMAEKPVFAGNDHMKSILFLGPDIRIETDGIVRYENRMGEDKFTYGVEILNIGYVSHMKLLNYVFDKFYPDFRSISDFSVDELVRLYEEEAVLALKPYGNISYSDYCDAIKFLEEKPEISYNLVNYADEKLIHVGAVLKILNHTYLMKEIFSAEPDKFVREKKVQNYSGLLDYLISSKDFEYLIYYVKNDSDWHNELFSTLSHYIKDSTKVLFENMQCVVISAEAAVEEAAASEYVCAQIDTPGKLFLKADGEKDAGISSLVRGSYLLAQDDLKEVNTVYNPLDLNFDRKYFCVYKKKEPVALIWADLYQGFNLSLLDNCILDFLSEDDTEDIVLAALPQLAKFYKSHGKERFQLLFERKNADAGLGPKGLKDSFGVQRVILSREGALGFKKMLMEQFADYNKYYSLTMQQLGMWNIEQVYPDTCVGTVSGTIACKKPMDFALLEQAINLCIKYNDSFGLRMVLSGNEPKQYLAPYSYKYIDLYHFEDEAELREWSEKNTAVPLKLIETDLYQFAMFHVKSGLFGFYFKLHHLMCDAWSIVVMANQLLDFYNKLRDNIEIVPPERLSYMDYIAKEKDYFFSKTFWNNKEFWDEKFDTYPGFNVLKPYVSGKSIQAKRKTFLIRRELTQRIYQFSEERKATPFTLFMSALILYFGKLSSKDDVVIGAPLLNRLNAKERITVGMFTNIVPMRFAVDGASSAAAFVDYVGKQLRLYMKNHRYPYDLLLQDLKKKHKMDKIFDVLFSYQGSKLDKSVVGDDYVYHWDFCGYQIESLSLHIDDRDSTGEFFANFDYSLEAFDEEEINKIYEYIVNLLDEVTKKPDSPVSELMMLSKTELDKMLYGFNANKQAYPKDKVFHQKFEEIVDLYPNRTAVICSGKSVTYRDLNSRANQLARILRQRGVGPETVVGLMANRSVDAIAGIFAILKAGGAYLPIDPCYPKDRVIHILKDSALSVLLTDSMADTDGLECERIFLDNEAVYTGSEENLENISKPSDLMYVIYTSGSTGTPKGVMIEHRNFINVAYAWSQEYCLDQFEVNLLQLASFSFDVFTGDLARTFLNGGTMVIATEEEKYNIPKLCGLISKRGISIFESTPQLVLPLMEYVYKNGVDVSSLKVLIAGSDICLNHEYRRLLSRFGNTMRVINSYGVTEATIDSSYYEARLEEIALSGNAPIGKPFGNAKFYILGDNFEVKPVGVAGELYIAGEGVARGYYNNKTLTDERFIDSPFVKGERIYKTGDLAKWLPDGNVAFLGRADTQVKVRGYRIELGEIESRILKNADIEETVVLVDGGTLYAFCIAEQSVDLSEVKEKLYSALPNYMVPSRFVRLSQFPLTPNGKVDKKALLEYCSLSKSEALYTAPETKTEEILCDMWAEALERETVGVTENFFDIGGDSLAAIHILSSAFSHEWNLSIQDFYKYPTVREMAKTVSGQQNKESEDDAAGTYSDVVLKHESGLIQVTKNYFVPENILLTGATGFLGIHLLYELLESTAATIYCLVRDNGDKLLALAGFYFNTDLSYLKNQRIFFVKGDIAKDRFTLADTEYKELAKVIDTVIHSAAIVKHYGSDKEFYDTNVLGTDEAIKFCKEGGARLVHISTTNVSGDTLKQNRPLDFCENDFYIGQNYKDNVYIKSKFQAENLVLQAMSGGLGGSIMRVGNLTGRYSDGVFQKNIENNMFYNMLKSILAINAVTSDLLDVEIELTPVDLCAKAICALVKIKESDKRIFHLFNNRTIKVGAFIECLNEMGYPVRALGKNEFLKYVKTLNEDGAGGDSALFLVNDYNFERAADENYKVRIYSDITDSYLNPLHFVWPAIDKEYVEKMIGYGGSVAFFKQTVHTGI